jgi:hypothetical protein
VIKSLANRIKGLNPRRNRETKYVFLSLIQAPIREELRNVLASLKNPYQGVIFYSDDFDPYLNNYESILEELNYIPIRTHIPRNTKIHDYLSTKIGELLAEAMVKDNTNQMDFEVKPQISSLRDSARRSIRTDFKKPELLSNLITRYLEQKSQSDSDQRNLMIIISNASAFTPRKLEPTINEVFSIHSAGLTLPYSSTVDIHKLPRPKLWFQFKPEEIVSDSAEKIWSKLEEEVRALFNNQETFTTFLSNSKGQTDLLREEWLRLWDEVESRNQGIL